jgi:predicted transcriptional regulator
MDYKLLTDKEIIKDLGSRVDYIRRIKELQVKEITEQSGISLTSYKNFIKGNSINLKTFIAIIRELKELDGLEKLFKKDTKYSPTGKNIIPPKRVFKKNKQLKVATIWEDEV